MNIKYYWKYIFLIEVEEKNNLYVLEDIEKFKENEIVIVVLKNENSSD